MSFSDFNFLTNIQDLSTSLTEKIDKSFLYDIAEEYYSTEKVLEFINSTCEKKFPKILIEMLDFFYEKKVLNYENEIDDEYIDMTRVSIAIIRNFSNESVRFRGEIHIQNGLKVLFKYLNDTNFLHHTLQNISLNQLFRDFVGCLENLCKSYENFKQEWKKQNSVETILSLSEKSKHVLDSQLACYMILAFITEEEEIAKFPDINKSIEGIVNIIAEITTRLTNKKPVQRISIEINELNESFEVLTCEKMNTQWSIIELLDALYHMAVNDSLKANIYFDNKMNEHLRILIENGNEIEKAYSIKLLWQLCFNSKISEQVFQDNKFFNEIEGYTKSSQKELSKNSNGCIWTINNKQTPSMTSQSSSKHIMISYNRESRDLCLKIKQDLEKKGHKIWIDVFDIHGSSLEAMAKAIEDSKCVLVCMTEKYKMSSNCRLEAEYALQINKPIVPLIMQPNYKPDGWLGLILGAKIFVNFTKYGYDECIRRVIHEINNTGVKYDTKSETSVQASVNENIDGIDKQEWTEDKIEEWIKEKKFNEKIVKNLLPCNGKMLKQLYEMLLEAPEFYYSSINSDKTVPLRDVLYFTTELKDLLKK